MKKVLIFVLIAAMTLSLCACGGAVGSAFSGLGSSIETKLTEKVAEALDLDLSGSAAYNRSAFAADSCAAIIKLINAVGLIYEFAECEKDYLTTCQTLGAEAPSSEEAFEAVKAAYAHNEGRSWEELEAAVADTLSSVETLTPPENDELCASFLETLQQNGETVRNAFAALSTCTEEGVGNTEQILKSGITDLDSLYSEISGYILHLSESN